MNDPIRLADRAVIRIDGPDAAALLAGVITQAVAPPAQQTPAFGALLTPQGKILADFIFLGDGDGYLFDVAAAVADDFINRMTLYRLRANVGLTRRDDRGVAIVNAGDPRGFADPRGPGLPSRLIAPPGEAGAARADYDLKRMLWGAPEIGADFGPNEVFPLDVNHDVLHGVDYRKGCFVGQEVTSRMKRKGEVRKRTLTARFDGPTPPRGTPIMAGESTIGEILSGVDGAALALIRIDRLDVARAAGAPITADGRALAIEWPGAPGRWRS
jgi:folate-binding protein YgfZ